MSEQNNAAPGSEHSGGHSSEHSSEHHSEHSGEHHSHHSSNHRHHHKRYLKIPKTALIIAVAAVVFVGLFVFLVQYLNRQDKEDLEIFPEVNAAESPESAAADEARPAEAEPLSGTETEALPTGSAAESVRWCALGESITYGYYSAAGPDGKASSQAAGRENIGWAYLVAKQKNWDLTNLAVPGEGYLVPAGGSGLSGYQQARATDFTPYSLVTLSLGISDWLSDCPMGTLEDDPSAETITSFIPAMRATIEAVAASNPMCKIIVILPLNTSGYEHNYGTKAANWALGHAMGSSGTLKQFSETMIDVCRLYGIQYIDMTTQSCVSSLSLPAMLPDGVHPAVETHKLLAAELAEKITFR